MNNKNTACETDEQVIDLRVYINILKKRLSLIALVTLLAALISAALSFFVLTPVYEAKTILLVTHATEKQQPVGQRDDLNAIVSTITRIPVLTMNTYVGQLKSDLLMQRVIDELKLDEKGYSPRGLAQQIKATAAKDSYLIDVAVSNSDPRLAADIANTLSKEFMAMMTEKNQEVMDRSVKFMQDQMEAIKGEIQKASSPAEKTRLEKTMELLAEGITKTQIARSIDLGSTSLVVVSPAMAPTSPVKPNKKLNIAVAFMLGLMFSVALAFILEFLDNTIKTPEDVAQHLELPVLAMIPSAGKKQRS